MKASHFGREQVSELGAAWARRGGNLGKKADGYDDLWKQQTRFFSAHAQTAFPRLQQPSRRVTQPNSGSALPVSGLWTRHSPGLRMLAGAAGF